MIEFKRRRTMPLAMALAAMLAGCSMAPDDHADGGLTVGENQRLEAAAARIDARTPSPATGEAAALEADVRARLARRSSDER